MNTPTGKCHACGKELESEKSLYCKNSLCAKDDMQRYVGESIEEASERLKKFRENKLSTGVDCGNL